jgi:hypothetical protein
VNEHIERLVQFWIDQRQPGEDFRAFTDRKADDELVAAATLRPIEEVRAELRPRAAHRTEAADA